MDKRYVVGYTTGVFDMFHIGHLNVLKNAKEHCDYLIVGVSTDKLVEAEKMKKTVIPYDERVKIVEAIKYVDKVVPQRNMDKMAAWEKYRFDMMFVGSDWKGTDRWKSLEKAFSSVGVEIIYLPHTDGISSTKLTEIVKKHISDDI